MRRYQMRKAFTLLELLVVMGIMGDGFNPWLGN